MPRDGASEVQEGRQLGPYPAGIADPQVHMGSTRPNVKAGNSPLNEGFFVANKGKSEGAEAALVLEKSARAAPSAHLSIESSHSLLGAFSGVFWPFRNQHGRGFLQIDGDTIVHELDGPEAELALLRRVVPTIGVPRPQDLRDVMDKLRALARVNSDVASVWLRVAPTADGVVIDVADVGNTRIWVTGDGVKIRNDQTGPLFYRTATMRPLTMPAETGDIEKLRQYINLPDAERWLLIGWLTYVLCHPRMASVAFPILLLLGDQGSGKSFLCRLIRALLDPGAVTSRVLDRAGNGAIVLMHVGSASTDVLALTDIIAGLRAAGYAFATVDAIVG